MVRESIKIMRVTKNDKGIQFRRRLKAIWFGLRYFCRHYLRYVRNCNCDYYTDEDSFLSVMIANYHTIEKCLVMPNFELGHGKERVLVVCGDLVKYRELGFDTNNVQYISALQAVDEYRRVHEDAHVDLGPELNNAIHLALDGQQFQTFDQPSVKAVNFFSSMDFESFAKSRHSVRAFSDKEISISVIQECVDIARTTPTACNRQPNKTYVICNRKLIEQIVRLQGGGRGFAENANKLLVVTSSVHVFGNNEICEAFKSGGMYTMNLLYALHGKKIGACTLEWNERIEVDQKIRQLLHISDAEEVTMIVAIGYPLEDFRYVMSHRNDLEKSMIVID